MANIPKAMFIGHSFCPFFNCSAFNFNGFAAALAHQVVMMGITA
jgi:hypothetical protein